MALVFGAGKPRLANPKNGTWLEVPGTHQGAMMASRSKTMLAGTLATLGVLSVCVGAFAMKSEPAPAPSKSVGQEVGEVIDASVETARSWTSSALRWARTKRDQGLAELDKRVADAKARAPEPKVGVKILSLNHERNLIETDAALVEREPSTLIILVHGFNEPGGIFDDLAPTLIDEGHAVATFHYPNDQAIAKSAESLGEQLRALHAKGVKNVAFVAHSMGGLVVRDVLTSSSQYASAGRGHKDLPDATHFIMAGTPNIGSNLARVAWVAEARESVVRWANSDSKDLAILLGALKDGDGQAGNDLQPGSEYLTNLNARPWPTGVAVTAIVGVAGEETGEGLAELVTFAKQKGLIDERQQAAATGAIREAVTNIGDGVVSETTQAPDGIRDVVRVHAFHRTMLKTLDAEKDVREVAGVAPKVAPAIPEITTRLRELLPSKPSAGAASPTGNRP